MTHPGWLDATWTGSRAALGRELHMRWPETLVQDNDAEALANRLGKTDQGTCPQDWWETHAALIPVLADIIARPESDVRAWIDSGTRKTPGPWRPPLLRSVVGARVDEPPKGLWSPFVEAWVERVERGPASTPHAWIRHEPGVSGAWLQEWFEHRGWHFTKAETWEKARSKVRIRSRNVIVLTRAWPLDRGLPSDLPETTICVLAPWEQAVPEGAASGGRKWYPSDVPTHDGWALLYEPRQRDPRECIRWFLDHCPPERRPDDSTVTGILREWDPEYTPGELLLRLDVALEDDPVTAFLARAPDVGVEDLVGMERGAAERRWSTRRPRDSWKQLVPKATTPEHLLSEVGIALAVKRLEHARKLVEGRPEAVVVRLVEQGVLQPCTDANAPADTWQIWPRWLGAELNRRALAELVRSSTGLGSALLFGQNGTSEALEELRRIARAGDWDQMRRHLDSDPALPEGMAVVEATILTLGHSILDGSTIPRELAGRALEAAGGVRITHGDGRLLAHGDGEASPVAMDLAEWALGHRAFSRDPLFGPWTDETPLEAHVDQCNNFERALMRWSEVASSGQVSEKQRLEASAMVRRVYRLGTLLFDARGLLRRSGEHSIWRFQVPAILRALGTGKRVLPGRSARDLLEEKAQGATTLADRAAQLMAHPHPEDFKDLKELEQPFVAAFGLMLMSQAPDAQVLKQAFDDVVRAATSDFTFIRYEIESTGGSFHDAVRWLWSRWNRNSYADSSLPPIALLRRTDLEDARLVWAAAPFTAPGQTGQSASHPIQEGLWQRASEEPAFWSVLPTSGWRAWALAGNDVEAGWQRMPDEVLFSLLDSGLPRAGVVAAWSRDYHRVMAWLLRALGEGETRASARERCLDAVPPTLVPEVLRRTHGLKLPRRWLQSVVSARMDGWPEAWERMK